MRNTEKFDWEEFIFRDIDLSSAFDERVLYREIRRNKLAQKTDTSIKQYQIYVTYDVSVNESYYITIFNRYFGVREDEISELMAKLSSSGGVLSDSLSSSVADLLISEIHNYLADNNLELNLVSKEVSNYAIKKPRNNLT